MYVFCVYWLSYNLSKSEDEFLPVFLELSLKGQLGVGIHYECNLYCLTFSIAYNS